VGEDVTVRLSVTSTPSGSLYRQIVTPHPFYSTTIIQTTTTTQSHILIFYSYMYFVVVLSSLFFVLFSVACLIVFACQYSYMHSDRLFLVELLCFPSFLYSFVFPLVCNSILDLHIQISSRPFHPPLVVIDQSIVYSVPVVSKLSSLLLRSPRRSSLPSW
jgi:hypothetical protein